MPSEVIPTPPIVAAVAVIPEEPQVFPVPSDSAVAFTVPVVIVFPETVVLLSDVPTVSCPAISAFDTARPVFVSMLPEPALKPVDVTVAVFVPSVTVRPEDASVEPVAVVPANTVPVVVRPESVSAEAPVEKDSEVTPVPVIWVFEVSFPTLIEFAAVTVLKLGVSVMP